MAQFLVNISSLNDNDVPLMMSVGVVLSVLRRHGGANVDIARQGLTLLYNLSTCPVNRVALAGALGVVVSTVDGHAGVAAVCGSAVGFFNCLAMEPATLPALRAAPVERIVTAAMAAHAGFGTINTAGAACLNRLAGVPIAAPVPATAAP